MKKLIYSLIMATTIDGKIATSSYQFTDWTSKEDKDFLHKLLDKSDAIVVGHNTYKTAKGLLSKRNCVVLTRKVSKATRRGEGLTFFNPARESLDGFIRKAKYKRVAVLGGTQTYTYFLENNLVDEIYLTIEPLVFGKGFGMFETKNVLKRYFRLASVKKLNKRGSLVLHYSARR